MITVPRDGEGRSRRSGSAGEAGASQASTDQPNNNPKAVKHNGAYRLPSQVDSGRRMTNAEAVRRGLEMMWGAAEFGERGT